MQELELNTAGAIVPDQSIAATGVPKVGAAMEGAKPRVKKGKIGKPIKEPTLAEEMDNEIPWLGDPPKKAVRKN